VRQVAQEPRSGRVTVEDVPEPVLRPGGLLVRTGASIVSPGTERMMLAFAEKSLLGKARERPDLVQRVWTKLRQDGIAQTYAAVQGRLDRAIPLGYSSAGTVLAVGLGAPPFGVGDTVACAGAGYAAHAEVAFVPGNLCARVPARPDGSAIPVEEAAFATLGAVALQGVRLAAPTLGERVVVVGLGVIGQLAVQLLRAHGCAVLGVDRDAARVALARTLGAEGGVVLGDEGAVAEIFTFTRGRGADAVLIAAATESNEPVELAGEISRRKGRVVVVGSVRMDVPRRTYYERELSVTVSCSYGPGRYDPAYEEGGQDYPVGYVRWTEQRNIEACLDLLAKGQLQVRPLITHRVPVAEAERAYRLLGSDAPEPSLGIVLTYEAPSSAASPRTALTSRPRPLGATDTIGVAVVGPGIFARSIVLPALRRNRGVRLRTVMAANGLTASRSARRFGFERATTDIGEVLSDQAVQAVFVLTPHRLHASLTRAALEAGRHVFVEKPLCVTEEELRDLASWYRSLGDGAAAPILTVGFNRRFSPLAVRLRAEIAGIRPLVLAYRVNAGSLPTGHWLEAPEEGGRIVGEACHFIDLATFLVGAPPARVFAAAPAGSAEPASMVVRLADGSVFTLTYVASGARRLPKERLEVFGGGRAWVLDDWRVLRTFGPARTRTVRLWTPARGHREELEAFVSAARSGGPAPIPFEHLAGTTQATFCALESLRQGVPVDVPPV
jgi:predicted dehydrogenase/threonine dehydrogenase-like Zn-dependent dehydrogenase